MIKHVCEKDFIEIVSVFEPERVARTFREYLVVKNECKNDKSVLQIMPLVVCLEIVNADDYAIVSAVIFKNGTIKYIACY